MRIEFKWTRNNILDVNFMNESILKDDNKMNHKNVLKMLYKEES
jgi:hypothetical protein